VQCSEALRLDPRNSVAHKQMAVALFMKERYADSWREVHLCWENEGELPPGFVDALSQRMDDPGR